MCARLRRLSTLRCKQRAREKKESVNGSFRLDIKVLPFRGLWVPNLSSPNKCASCSWSNLSGMMCHALMNPLEMNIPSTWHHTFSLHSLTVECIFPLLPCLWTVQGVQTSGPFPPSRVASGPCRWMPFPGAVRRRNVHNVCRYVFRPQLSLGIRWHYD